MQNLQPFLQTDTNQPSQSALIETKCANQVQRCPRCDSTNTKFCYYNNYNLKQPCYFCKSCKRYWTKGGSLRNVPLGGRCRKNKKSSTHSSAQKNREAIEREGFVKNSSMVDTLSIAAVPAASADYKLSTITSATLTNCDGFLSANAPAPRNLGGNSAIEYMKFSASAMEMEPVMTFSDVATSCNLSPNSALSPMGSSVTSRYMRLPDEEEGLGVTRGQELKLPSSGSIAIVSRGRSENSSSVFDREGSSELHLFVPFDTEIPLLDGLSPLDSSFMAFNYSHSETLKSPEQNFQEKNGDKFTQTSQALKESIRDASPVSLTENVIVSSTGLNLTYSPNSNCKWRLPNLEYHQQHSESKTCCIMPADELLIDEQAWGFLSTDTSADTSDHTRNYLAIPSSEDRVYEVENLEFEYQIGSKGYFDPTNDSYYMGGPGVWSGFPLFGVGSDLT